MELEQKKFLNQDGLKYFMRKLNEKKANLESPAFTGLPTVPTSDGTEEHKSQIANVEFVLNTIEEKLEEIENGSY